MVKRITILLIFSLILLSSCNKHQRILKKADKETKYNKAIELYEKGDYVSCLTFLDDIIPLFRGTDKSEKLYFMYPNCYYKTGDYILAGYHYDNFAKLYPKSIDAEEATYMSAYCSYLDSPKSSLDQTSSFTAMDELQAFVNKYPNSPRVSKCNEIMDEIREKLAKKYFDIAMTYYYTESFQAANISFENLLKDYPDTKLKETIQYYIIKNYFQYAINSIEAKQIERINKTIELAEQFLSTYPSSKYKEDIELQKTLSSIKKEKLNN